MMTTLQVDSQEDKDVRVPENDPAQFCSETPQVKGFKAAAHTKHKLNALNSYFYVPSMSW